MRGLTEEKNLRSRLHSHELFLHAELRQQRSIACGCSNQSPPSSMGKSVGLLRAAALTSSAAAVANAAGTHHACLVRTTERRGDPAHVQSDVRFRQQTTSSDVISNSICAIRGGDKGLDNDTQHSGRTASPKPKSARKRRTANENSTKSAESKASTNETNKTTKNKAAPSRVQTEILKESDYYKILGLSREEVQKASNPDQRIQKAYRRRAVQTHPDKTGGDRRAFDKVAEAYDVLQDTKKRKIYDRYGKRGLDAGMGGVGAGASTTGASGMAAEDLFRSFFGTGAASPFGGSFGQPSRNRSMRFEVDVTLEDIYAGKTMKVVLPGSKTPIDLTIARGSYHNQDIVASGVIDNDSNLPPGDAHFRLKVRPHPTFTCKGYDLAIQMEISLAEAITGVSRTIRHLDGRLLRVVSAPASSASTSGPDMIVSGDVHILKGEGMPKNAMGTEFGDLYVQYQIKMPKHRGGSFTKDHVESLTETERHELERLLNKLEGKAVDAKSTKTHWPFKSYGDSKILKKASASEFGKHGPSVNEESSSFESFGDTGFSPFGNRGFYWSSTTTSGGPNPFGQSSHDDEAQCRQM